MLLVEDIDVIGGGYRWLFNHIYNSFTGLFFFFLSITSLIHYSNILIFTHSIRYRRYSVNLFL